MGKRAVGPASTEKMREVLCEIAKRLGEVPTSSGELIRKRAETSDSLYKNLDGMKEKEINVAGAVATERNGDGRPVFPNEAVRNAEISRRLKADTEYQGIQKEVDRLRQELRKLDAQIEETSQRHRSDSNIVNLVSSMLGAGLKDEAARILSAYAEGITTPKTPIESSTSEMQQTRDKDGDLETGVFLVLETRPGRNEGTIRAYVEAKDGTRTALFAKNGAGQTLATAIGKKVEAQYRRLDKGLYAIRVCPVA